MSEMITTRSKQVNRILLAGEEARHISEIQQNWEKIKTTKTGRIDMYTHWRPGQAVNALTNGAWSGSRCFIIGGGPSLKNFNFLRLGQELTIATNRAIEYINPTIAVWMDYRTFYQDIITGKFGEKAKHKFISTTALKVAINLSGYEYPEDVISLAAIPVDRLSSSMAEGIGIGKSGNTGFAALNLAVCLGANPIYLLGYDMHGDGRGNQAWFHSGYKSDQGEGVYKEFLSSFNSVAPVLKEHGIEIVNLNPDSALICFEFGQFDKIKNIPEIETDQSKLISIVMPTYNQEKYIKQAIYSILEQTHRNFELIIINDGSTDNTERIIKSFSDERIKYIKKKNGGTGSALNEGFRIANGRYETWFSSDSVMYPDCLKTLLKYLDESPEGFIYGNSDILNTEGGKTKPLGVKPFDRELLLKTCYLGIANMWRRDLRLKAGGLYAETPSEDFDMYLRMSELSDFKYIPIALAGWRDHPENLTQTTTLPSGWKDHYRFVNEAKKRKEEPFFSIMVVTYNRPELFQESLDSIKKQTFERFEVLIVSKSDDPDTDKEIVKSLKDNRFKWLKTAKLPVYTIRNSMIEEAKGWYITVLDDDDLFPEDALKDRHEFILKNYAPDFIYSDYMRFGTAMESVYHKAEPLTADFILDHKGTKSKMIGANLTVWKSVLKKMKYDNVVFPDNVGDCDLAIRLLKANLRFGVLNKMTYMYRAHPGQVSYTINKDFECAVGLWKEIYKKHGRTWK